MTYLDVYTKLYKLAEKFNGGWKIDKNRQPESAWSICYHYYYGYNVSPLKSFRYPVAAIYFHSQEAAQQALDSLTEEEKDLLIGKKPKAADWGASLAGAINELSRQIAKKDFQELYPTAHEACEDLACKPAESYVSRTVTEAVRNNIKAEDLNHIEIPPHKCSDHAINMGFMHVKKVCLLCDEEVDE